MGGLHTIEKPLSNNPGSTWRLTNSAAGFIPIDASSVQNNANSAPDTASIFSNLASTPNLTAFAVEGRNAISSASTTATTLINTSRTNLKTSLGTSLDTLSGSLSTSLTPIQTQLGDTITATKSSINTQFGTVFQYNDIRIYGQMGLVLLYIIPIVFINLGGLSRRAGCMKTCNLVAVPYYLLLYIFGILFLVLTVLVGDLCTVVFDTKPSPLNSIDPLFGKVLNAVDSCYSGASLLNVVGSLQIQGLNASQLNLSQMARTEIDKFNISSMTQFDLGFCFLM
jgi:hypothetical protein